MEGEIAGLKSVGGLAEVWEGVGSFVRCNVSADLTLEYDKDNEKPGASSCGILFGQIISGDTHFIDCEAKGAARVNDRLRNARA